MTRQSVIIINYYKNMDIQDVIVIGGGVAGLSAAMYLGRAGLRPLVFAGSPPGGQLMLTTEIENFPGQKPILGADLIDILRKQATTFGATIVDENIKSVEVSGQLKSVTSANGKTYEARTIVIATGAKALWMGLPSEARLRGKGVSACATCDGFFFKNKIVAVIGGGDCALEEAITLTKFASKVYIIHRRGEFKASKIMQKRVEENEKIEAIWNATVEEITGQFKVESLKLKVPEGEKVVKLDGVFVAIGHKPDTELFNGKIELDKKGYILTFSRLAEEVLKGNIELSEEKKKKIIKHGGKNLYSSHTSVHGVFAAGDCVDPIHQQASVAAGLGVQAALDTERWLEEEKI